MPAKGCKCSEETRKKISESSKGKTSWAKGKKLSEEHKRKISLSNKGKTRRGHPFPEWAKEKLRSERSGSGNPMSGLNHSEETKIKMSKARKGIPCPWARIARLGMPSPIKGRKHSAETIEKLKGKIPPNKGIPNIHAIGEKNYNWKGGVTYDKSRYNKICKDKRRARKQGNGGSYTFFDWNKLKEKYLFTCPVCGKREPEIKLTADHIIPISLGGSNYIENIQPLCKSCNCRKHVKEVFHKPIAICA